MEGPPRAYADQLYPVWWIPGVAHAWLTRTAPPPPERADLALIHQRLGAVTTRVANGTAGRLLALPTHEGGWIEPAALVERLREAGEDVDEPELAQALLRLAPDGRATALGDAADLPGRPGALLRCALGGPAVEGDDIVTVAARTVREPPLDPAPEAHVRVEVEDWVEFRTRITAPAATRGALRATAASSDLVDPLLWPGRRDLTCAVAIAARRVGDRVHAGRRPGRPAAARAAAAPRRAADAARDPAADRGAVRLRARGPHARRGRGHRARSRTAGSTPRASPRR